MRKKRIFRAEPLESRCLLAGDVEVFFENDNLFIWGDALANEVAVELNAAGDRLDITGLAGTNIIGTAGDPILGGRSILVADILGDVNVSLRAGDDSIVIDALNANMDQFSVSGSLLMNGGPGMDDIQVLGGSVSANAVITGGLDNDLVRIDGLEVLGNLDLRGEDGVDNVIVEGDASVGGHATVRLDAGADTLSIDGLNVTGNLSVLAGDGDDVVTITDAEVGGALGVNLTSGANSLNVGGAVGDSDLVRVFGNLVVTGGDLANTLTLAGNVVVRGDAHVTLGAAADIVTLGDAESGDPLARFVVLGDLNLNAGGGADLLCLHAWVGGDMTVEAEAGDDGVVVESSRVVGILHILGGGGHDTLGVATSLVGRLTVSGALGDDRLYVDRTGILRDHLIVNMGAGADQVFVDTQGVATIRETAFIYTLEGNDIINFSGQTQLDLRIDGGDDLDAIVVNDSFIQGEAIIKGGFGNDKVLVGGNVEATLGLTILTNAGDDDLLITAGVTTGGQLLVGGGIGSDGVINNSGIPLGQTTIHSIERVADLVLADFDFTAQLTDLEADLDAICAAAPI